MSLQGKSILLVDDDRVLSTLLTRVLSVAGCQINSCSSILAAIEQLRTFIPELVILDLDLPELDGFTYFKLRNLNPLLASIPVIILSGTKNEQNFIKATQMGAVQIIKKPFEARIVLQKLRLVFHSSENFVYRFPKSQLPRVEVQISGAIMKQSPGRVTVSSQVKLRPGKSVRMQSQDPHSTSENRWIFRVDHQPTELKEGLFQTVLTAVGHDFQSKQEFDLWLRSLSL
jgi:DNA-binding response OmpR family regulator